MRNIVLPEAADFNAWRSAARGLALAGVPPDQVVWSVGAADDLFGDARAEVLPTGALTVPKSLLGLAETAIQARAPERFALLYTLLWRAHHGEKFITQDVADPVVQRVSRLAQAVRRDTHKMRAFLRFREVTQENARYYVGWFEPAHYIVEANAPFFVRRFAGMTWSILTPYRSAHWDGEALHFSAGATKADVPDDDRLAEYWQVYFSSIFNPARLKIGAMTSEMPKKYWRNLPEAAAIPELIRAARARTDSMVDTPVLSAPRASRARAAAPTVSSGDVQFDLITEQAGCRRCGLWQAATQTVPGVGPAPARLMLVGEQPGDQEDLAGLPFVGPAGQVLDRALAEVGIDRADVYVTNAVKHFKFEPRGKRRIHARPNSGEIAACRFWLDRELDMVKPAVVVLLGASAAQAVLRRTVSVGRERGVLMALRAGAAILTVHPAYLLRLPDQAARVREYASFVGDLRVAGAAARVGKEGLLF